MISHCYFKQVEMLNDNDGRKMKEVRGTYKRKKKSKGELKTKDGLVNYGSQKLCLHLTIY